MPLPAPCYCPPLLCCWLALLLSGLLPLAAAGQVGAAAGHRQRLNEQARFAGWQLGQQLVPDSTFEEQNDYGYPGHWYAPLADTARLFGYLVCPWQIRTDDDDRIVAIELRATDSLTSYRVLQQLQARYGPGHFEEHGASQRHIWMGKGIQLIYFLRPDNSHYAYGTLVVAERRPTPH